MQSKGNAPTQAQKDWREAVRELGSVISGAPAVIHHPIGCGKNAKHNKIHIGHWWVIPLTDEEHKALHNGFCIWEQSHPDMFETRKEFEKGAFKELMFGTQWRGPLEIPGPDKVSAIMDYHR